MSNLQNYLQNFWEIVPSQIKTGQWWLKAGITTALVYGMISLAFFFAMRQPPQHFARIMSKLPEISMVFFPFESMWSVARAGSLKTGELVPDFRLRKYESTSWVQLSEFRGNRPVVLIFGSYT